ncbi:MAG: hypothetical protein Q4F80_08095 [bacterium]|nr:hypothetical protein [bacterium]
MNDLFKNLLNKTQCKRNGICSSNPVLNAVDAVIINEIRQISYYIVKLKEFNLTNFEVMKETVYALSVNITDIGFNKNALYSFYANLKNIKEKVKNFYIKKCKESNVSFELITPFLNDEEGEIDSTKLIKRGENIIHHFYNTIKDEKVRLINLIILTCRMTSLLLVKLSEFKEAESDYYFEILRLLSLTNHTGTREEKFIRRIKEFSNKAYEIQKELDYEFQKTFGGKTTGKTDTNIYEGKSVLIAGGDLDELFNLLNAAKKEKINVYINPSMLLSIFYPKFREFPNFKGIYGINEVEFDFSKFKGPIYITENSSRGLDSAFRGTIFSTKLIPADKTIKLDKKDLTPLIEEAKKLEGFKKDVKGEEIVFEYNLDKIQKTIEENEGKKFVITLGLSEKEAEEKFKGFVIINFSYPFETEGLYFALEKIKPENLSIYFSDCSLQTVNTIVSILDKNISEIYLAKCPVSSINPHITDCLKYDFHVKSV